MSGRLLQVARAVWRADRLPASVVRWAGAIALVTAIIGHPHLRTWWGYLILAGLLAVIAWRVAWDRRGVHWWRGDGRPHPVALTFMAIGFWVMLLGLLKILTGLPVTAGDQARVVAMVAIVALTTVMAVRHVVWAGERQEQG
jgi:hypothetical protein